MSLTTSSKDRPAPETLKDEHVCHWTQEYAILSREHHIVGRQLRANDRSKQTMARNCQYYDRNGFCSIDPIDGGKQLRPCRQQCGQKGARIDHEAKVLYYE